MIQPITAGSTHEAELIALSTATDEGTWLRRLLQEISFAVRPDTHFISCPTHRTSSNYRDAQVEMREVAQRVRANPIDDILSEDPVDTDDGLLQMPPTPICCDNKGTTATVNNPVSAAWSSRHLDRRYFQCRDRIQEGKIRCTFCRTNSNLADFFTKGLPTDLFKRFKRLIMNIVTVGGG